MATISIADNDARKQYTQAVTANSTQLTIDFPFFSLDDINVIVTNTSGVDTTLSRGTGTGTFAVTGAAVDDGFSGGDITLGDTYPSGTKFTIFRDITIERTTDFPASGAFDVSALIVPEFVIVKSAPSVNIVLLLVVVVKVDPE